MPLEFMEAYFRQLKAAAIRPGRTGARLRGRRFDVIYRILHKVRNLTAGIYGRQVPSHKCGSSCPQAQPAILN